MLDADAVGCAGTAGHGPFMKVYLRIAHETVGEASFETYGCPWAQAAGLALVVWVEGKPVSELRTLRQETIEQQLPGLPKNKRHCARLAVEALRAALEAHRRGRLTSPSGAGG